MLSSTPKAIQSSENVCKKILRNRTKFVTNQIDLCASSSKKSVLVQTTALLKRVDIDERSYILEKANIPRAELTSDVLVAMKADMGIPWEKLKVMSRLDVKNYYSTYKHLQNKLFL